MTGFLRRAGNIEGMATSPTLRRRARHGAAAVAALTAFVLTALVLGAAGPGTPGASAQSVGAKGRTVQVELKALKFKPDKVTVKVGDTVAFVWKEKVQHNVVFKDKVKSKIISSGTYTRRFTKDGTYKYDCTLHPGMKGEVKVTK